MKSKTAINIAHALAQESHCVSMQVGAILVRDSRIISTGINGTPAGFTNCDDLHVTRGADHTAWSEIHEIHAEMNALLFAAKHGISTTDSTMFVTHEPCQHCLKNMIQAGVSEVVYDQKYYRESHDARRQKADMLFNMDFKMSQFHDI